MKADEIARYTGGRLIPKGDVLKIDFKKVSSLKKARADSVSFLKDKKFIKDLCSTSAGLVFIGEDISPPDNLSVIVTKEPYHAFLKFLEKIVEPEEFSYEDLRESISKNTKIHPSVKIFPGVYIGEGVEIKENSIIYPGVFIGKNSKIGKNVTLYPNVVLYKESIIGDNVTIHANSVIGSDGFGYLETEDGKRKKIPQLGNVIIEDDVEIGSNVSIDRAVFDSTVIKRGVKIDNLVQIAHNVIVGENSVLASQTGISGSVEIGKFVVLAGQVGVADHLTIGDRVTVTAKSGVPSSIKDAGIYSGIPVMPHSLWLRVQSLLKKLPEIFKKLK